MGKISLKELGASIGLNTENAEVLSGEKRTPEPEIKPKKLSALDLGESIGLKKKVDGQDGATSLEPSVSETPSTVIPRNYNFRNLLEQPIQEEVSSTKVQVGDIDINLEESAPSYVSNPQEFAVGLKKKIQTKQALTPEEYSHVKNLTGFDDENTQLALLDTPRFLAKKSADKRESKKKSVVDYLTSQDEGSITLGLTNEVFGNYDLENPENVKSVFNRLEATKKSLEAKAAQGMNQFNVAARNESNLAKDELKPDSPFMQAYNNLKDWKAIQVAQGLKQKGITDIKTVGLAIQKETDGEREDQYWKSHAPDTPTGVPAVDAIRTLFGSGNDTPLQDYGVENLGANYLKEALEYDIANKYLTGGDATSDVAEYKKASESQNKLYEKYPDVRKAKLENAIGFYKAQEEGLTKDSEDNGKLSRFGYVTTGEDVIRIAKENGLYDTAIDRQLVDKIASQQDPNPLAQMFMPAYELYRRSTSPIENYSFTGQLAGGVKDVVENTGKSILDLTKIRSNREISAEQYNEDVMDMWKKDHSKLDTTQKNIALIGNTTGQVVGQGLTTLAGSSIAKGAGLAAKISQNVGVYGGGMLSAYDGAKKTMLDATDSDIKAEAGALLIAGITGLSEGVFQDTKIFGDVFGKKIGNIIKGIDEDKLFTEATRSELSKAFQSEIPRLIKNFGKEANKEGIEEVLTAVGEDVIQATFGERKNFDIGETFQKAKDTYVSTLIGGSLAAGVAARTNVKANPNAATALYHAAENPSFYISSIMELQKQKQITDTEANKKIQIINTASNINKEINTLDDSLSDRQKAVYVSLRTTQAQMQEMAEKTTDPTIKAKLEANIKMMDEEKDRILNGLQFNENLQPLNSLYDKEQVVREAQLKADEDPTEQNMDALFKAKEDFSKEVVNYYTPKGKSESETTQQVETTSETASDTKLSEPVEGLNEQGEPIATIPPKEVSTVSESEVENTALKDVESTTKALIDNVNAIDDIVGEDYKGSITDISEAYHKAKADGKNPQLVKAVEEALTPKQKSGSEVDSRVEEINKRRDEELETLLNPSDRNGNGSEAVRFWNSAFMEGTFEQFERAAIMRFGDTPQVRNQLKARWAISKQKIEPKYDKINSKYDAEIAALPKQEAKPTVSSESGVSVEERQSGFRQAGEKSRDTKDATHIGRWMLDNSQKGDVVKFEDGGYEVTDVTTKKDGTKEVVLTPFEYNADGTKDYNNTGIKIISEQSIKNGSNLFENAYTNSKGERVVEQSTYEPKQEAKPTVSSEEVADIEKSKKLISEYGNAAAPESISVEEKLKKIGTFFKNEFGWNITYAKASKENNRVEFTIDGQQVNLPEGANIRVMGGGSTYAAFTMDDVIKAKYQSENKPIQTKPTVSSEVTKGSFDDVPKVSNTKEEGQQAQDKVFEVASNLEKGTVITNGETGIQIVTENIVSKNGTHTVGITEFERQSDGSLIQVGDTQFVTKDKEGKVKSQYNPHTTYTNGKGERVTDTAKITADKIDLSKEKVFVTDRDGNIVESNSYKKQEPSTPVSEGKEEVIQSQTKIESDESKNESKGVGKDSSTKGSESESSQSDGKKEGLLTPPPAPPKDTDKAPSDGGAGKKPPTDNESIFGEGEEGKNNKKEFDEMTSSIPNSGEVKKYLSGDTIKKYEKDKDGNEVELRNPQEIVSQELDAALKHGLNTVEKAKQIFGDDYVNKTLDYIEVNNLSPENKALLYVSLENEMAKRIQGEPDNEGLKKLQDLVRSKSQAYLRSNSLAINMGRLRKFAEAGYDISKVTDKFFSRIELEDRSTVENLVQADAKTIQKQYEENQSAKTYTDEEIEAKIKEGAEKLRAAERKVERAGKKAKVHKAIDDITDKWIKKLSGKDKGDSGLNVQAYGITAEKALKSVAATMKAAYDAGETISNVIQKGIDYVSEKLGNDIWDKIDKDEFRKDYEEQILSGKEIDYEAQQKRQNAKEYKMLETERNRQLARVADLNEKLKTLQGGERPAVNPKEAKPDTPEIEELKRKVKEETQRLNSIEAQQKRVEDLEVELERLQNRQPKEKGETNKREISEKEKELKNKINEEKALIRQENKENNELRLSDAKEAVRRRIEKIKTEIYNKERELKQANKPLNEDLELQRLKEIEKSITELRDKYLPEEKDPYELEKQRERAKDKLVNDIISLNDQINAGERNKKADTPNYENDAEINNLRKIRDDKKAILNEIDPLAAPKEKTAAERVATAEENLQKKIDSIRDEIVSGEREVAKSKDKLQSKRLDQLREQKKALETLRDKYLPKGKDPYADKKAAKAVEDKLIKENIELNRQIAKGEKDIKDKKSSTESQNIDKLKAERDARKEILEAIDPTPKMYVQNALIEQGFGKTIKVKTKNGVEERQVLDWKKLAGEEGSIDKISENVAKSLEKSGFTPDQLERMQDAFIEEYTNIRKDVIEKGLNEIAARNKTTVTADQKSAAKKLAEMYNYGLFDKDLAGYEVALAKTIGIEKLNKERVKEVVELGEAMSKLLSSSFQGNKLTEQQTRSAIQVIEEKMRYILNKELNEHGSTRLKIADTVQSYMDLVQRMTLNSIKQAAENPLSGQMESLFSAMGYAGTIPKELNADARKMARQIYKEIVLEKGTGYGEVQSAFINKGTAEMTIDRMSDSKLIQGLLSTLVGKTTLDAVDSMYKAKITQQKFVYNLITVLTKDRLINGKVEKGMSKQDAQNYVAKQLTGQSFKDAQETARNIIKDINDNTGKKIFNDSPLFVDRLAHDIVTAALINGQAITEDMVKASYNAAYRAAGRGLGHVANNFITRGVGTVTGEIESRYKEAVKEKEYGKAATLRMFGMVFRNIINPFVGGGSNWIVLKAEKTGLGLISGAISLAGRGRKVDLTTESGMRNLENAMYEDLKIKDKFIRGISGGITTALAALLIAGVDSDDEYKKWLKRNPWAEKYTSLITPEIILASMAKDDKKLMRYYENFVNKNEYTDKGLNSLKVLYAITTGDEKAGAKAGALLGSMVGAPAPWRLVRDFDQIWTGASGGDPYKVNSTKPETFLQGFFKAGMLDYMGLAPQPENNWFTKEDLKSPSFKILEEKEIDVPKIGSKNQYKVEIDKEHPEGLMTEKEYDEFTTSKRDLLKTGIDKILKNTYKVVVKDKEGDILSEKEVQGKNLPTEQLKDKIESLSTELTKYVKKKMNLTGNSEKTEVKDEGGVVSDFIKELKAATADY